MKNLQRSSGLLISGLLVCGGVWLSGPTSVRAQVNITTYHNDVARTGANLNETVLNLGNVTPVGFGKVFSQSVDGYIYAQPLLLSGITIAGKGMHNVVFVATEHNSVYAFDADTNSGDNAAPLWQVNLGPSVPTADVGSGDVVPEIGITSTPVIDPNAGVIYVVAKTKEDGIYFQRLHALDISDGTERPGSPAIIEATIPGIGDGSVDGQLAFDPLRHMNRPALLLMGGIVYIAFASHGDVIPYHGWVFGYDAASLQRVSVFCTTPNGLTDPSGYPIGGGGIWHAGGGPAADPDGNIYVITGNGTFDVDPIFGGGIDYGDSFVKIDSKNGLAVASFFTPFNQDYLNRFDVDLGSSGPLLLPDSAGSATHPHLMVGAGKEGTIYLIDRDNMGGFTDGGPDQIVQTLPFVMGGAFGSPAFFNGTLYYNGSYDALRAFRFVAGQIDPPYALSQSFNYFAFPGATPSVSANGTVDGIVWVLDNGGYAGHFPTILHAYNATDLTQELYNSGQIPGRDTLGPAVKFTTPTIANGKVYVGAQYELNVLGLANFPPHPQITLTPDGAVNPVGTTHLVTAQVTDTIGFPRFGATVRFAIVEGPNAGLNSDVNGGCPFGCQTDFNGNVAWTYVSNGEPGKDRIEACTPDPTTGEPQCSQVTKEWLILPDSFAYPDFSTTDGLTLVGSAKTFENRLRLTPADFGLTGAAWVNLRQPVGDGFDTTFQFQITDLANTGADGFAFVIQNGDQTFPGAGGLTALGGGGGGMGYFGLANSLAVEFDTWFNSDFSDPSDNHISVHTFGMLQNSTDEFFSLGAMTAIHDLSDGDIHTARITYTPGRLQVFLDDLTTPVLSVPADIGAILNLEHGHAWVGFTAATGGAAENHDLLSWSYTRTLREICNDGLDNDSDGLIDDADPDCQNVHRPLLIVLTPDAPVGLLSSPCTMTATVTDADGIPQPGVFVWFQVYGQNYPLNSGHVGGQNQGCDPPDCRTDASGSVRWTYVAAGFPGFDFIQALAYDVPLRTRFEADASREWQATPPPPPGNGDGLLGVYYDNIDFTGPTVTRVDPVIAFDWGGGSPDPAIEPDTFSVRWTGLVQAQFSETYSFYALTDDGFRLWVDDQLIIDSFIDQPPTFHSGTISLLADQKYKIQIDYYENGVGAVVQLYWTSPSTPFQFVPQSQLYSTTSDTVPPTTKATLNGTLGENGWYTSEVSVVLDASDNPGGSGVKEIVYSLNSAPAVTTPSTTLSIPVSTEGVNTLSFYAIDNAGTVEKEQTLTINIDTSLPVVSYTGNAGTYSVDTEVNIICSAVDAISGIASTDCKDINGPAYSFGLGTHTFSATATDQAGNVGTGSTSFTVTVDFESLANLTTQFVTKAGVAKSLVAILEAAQAADARGNANALAGLIKAFTNEVSAQSGKALTASQAELLIQLAQSI